MLTPKSSGDLRDGVREAVFKVIITSNELAHEGGVANYVSLLLERFQQPDIALNHHALGSRAADFYRPWRRRLMYPFFYAFDLGRLLKRLLSEPDIRIVQVNPSLIPLPLLRDGLVVLMAKLLGRSVVVVIHGWKEHFADRLRASTWMRRLFLLVYGRADRLLVLAARFGAELQSLGIPKHRIATATIMFAGDTIPPVMARASGEVVFLFLGRISPLKGIHELIEATGLLKQRGLRFRALVAGHGVDDRIVGELQKAVASKGLTECVAFLGRVEGTRKSEVLAGADVYVLPSWQEGAPTTVVEALAAGLFVIATPVGAIPEMIQDGSHGLLVQRRDAEDLARKMEWCIQNANEIRGRRQANAQHAFARFEAGTATAQMARVYRQLLKGSNGAAGQGCV